MLIGLGLPTIPKHLLEKIQWWEYIEMANLLPSTITDDSALPASSTPAHFPLFPGYEIIISKKQNVTSIAEWVQVFAVYMAAIVA